MLQRITQTDWIPSSGQYEFDRNHPSGNRFSERFAVHRAPLQQPLPHTTGVSSLKKFMDLDLQDHRWAYFW